MDDNPSEPGSSSSSNRDRYGTSSADAQQQQRTATELPLFPLNLVLFPHMIQHLHIFEERYKEMVNRCLHESQPFGIVLIVEGRAEGSGNATTHAIGCSARIVGAERLPDGCLNIAVEGEQRFRILTYHDNLPYRVALTVPIVDSPSDADVVLPLADEVQKLMRDYLSRYLALRGQAVTEFDLPDEPEQLSYTAACILTLDDEEKQALLEDTDTASRLRTERDVLLREVTRLRRAAESAGYVWAPVTSERLSSYQSNN